MRSDEASCKHVIRCDKSMEPSSYIQNLIYFNKVKWRKEKKHTHNIFGDFSYCKEIKVNVRITSFILSRCFQIFGGITCSCSNFTKTVSCVLITRQFIMADISSDPLMTVKVREICMNVQLSALLATLNQHQTNDAEKCLMWRSSQAC